MTDNAMVVSLFLLIFLSVFLVLGEPDLLDVIIYQLSGGTIPVGCPK